MNFSDPQGNMFGMVSISMSLSIQNIVISYYCNMINIMFEAFHVSEYMLKPAYEMQYLAIGAIQCGSGV